MKRSRVAAHARRVVIAIIVIRADLTCHVTEKCKTKVEKKCRDVMLSRVPVTRRNDVSRDTAGTRPPLAVSWEGAR